MKFRNLVFGILVLPFIVAGLGAHHSFAALFDVSKTIVLTGEITKVEFKSPHAYIHIKVAGNAGAATAWQIETTTPGMLIRQGITPESLRTGQKISVDGNPTRDGRKILRLLTITMPDGKKLKVQ